MFRMLKYELLRRYMFILGGCAAIIITNVTLLLGVNVFGLISEKNGSYVVLSFMATFAALVVAVVGAIERLRKDLFTDTGYLTFTVPQRGYSIIGAKLTASLIEFILFAAFGGAFGLLHVAAATRSQGYDIIPDLMPRMVGIIFVAIAILIAYTFFVMQVYFSLALAKSLLKNRKFGKVLAFAIFIGISILSGVLDDFINKIFPQTVNLDLGRLFRIPSVGAGALAPVNIAGVVLNIVLFILLFAGTSYLVEEKADI